MVCSGEVRCAPTVLSVIRSFHEDMTAVVRVGYNLTEDIEVTTGLRQGCTLAPTLFNLYFSTVLACWRVAVRYRIGRKLVGDRTAKSRLQEIRMTESQFADDVAVYAATREALEQVAATFVNTTANWGLTVSLEKTKLLTLGKQLKPEDNLPVQLDGSLSKSRDPQKASPQVDRTCSKDGRQQDA